MKLINVRKLAALDVHFHGSRFVLIEFTVGVVLCAALGVWFVISGLYTGAQRSVSLAVFGIIMIGIAVNYLSLFLYAVAVIRQHSAQSEVLRELANPGKYMRLYSIQSALFILLPLALALLAVFQEFNLRTRQ